MKTFAALIYFIFIIYSLNLQAQVAINEDGSLPDSSAMLEVKSTSKGLLLPRLTVDQRDAIIKPTEGLIVFCVDCGSDGSLSIFSNGSWRTYSPCGSATPNSGSPSLSPGQITWNWGVVSDATGYKWNSTSSYSSATNTGSNTSYTETGLLCDTTYTRYVWSYNRCSKSSSVILTQAIPADAPTTPALGTHTPAKTQIIWNWNTVSGAVGYKWHTTNDFYSATEMGTDTSETETMLTCGTAYTRYVWAYNGCGFSNPLTLTQSTLACWSCGDSITINHVAGDVAPVNKTVNYGTVNNIPGELTKCWITSNLGADHQADSVSDTTEASAGWYWQFNHKQGYKHDGTTRTPDSTWLHPIYEDSDWQTVNDPCNIELGGGWRIPVYTEWINVDASGSWTNWNGPWNSGLKLHAAGLLLNTDGSQHSRGAAGYYWSTKQLPTDIGYYLIFWDGNSLMNSNDKSYGFSLRCIKD